MYVVNPLYEKDGVVVYAGDSFLVSPFDLLELQQTRGTEYLASWLKANAELCGKNSRAISALNLFERGAWGEQWFSRDDLVALTQSPFVPAFLKKEAEIVLAEGWHSQNAKEWRSRVFGFGQTDPAQKGWIYILEGNGCYKIGLTKDMARRLPALKTQMPFSVTLFHSIPSDDISAAERKLHGRFKNKRIHGEWFALDENDLRWLKSLEVI